MEAYILVKISTQEEVYGFNRFVVEKLSAMKGVESAELLFGDYDAIVKLKVPKIHDCENLVIEELSTIEGVQSTVTLLCIDEKNSGVEGLYDGNRLCHPEPQAWNEEKFHRKG